jgi:hypothetical protein
LHLFGAVLAVLAALWWAQPAGAQTTTLHLRNGDRISGVIVIENAQQVTIDSPLLGRIIVPTDRIERREAKPAEAPPAPPLPKISPAVAEQRLRELTTLYQSGGIDAQEYHRRRSEVLAQVEKPQPAPVVAAPAVPAPPAAPAQAAAAKPPPRRTEPKRWSGDAQLGADLGFSETRRQLYTGRMKLTYAYEHFRHSFDYLFAYGRTEDVLSANRMDGFSKTDWDLNQRSYVYNLGGAGYDEIRRINLRYEAGPGLGRHFVLGTNFVVNGEFGVNYQVQERADNTTTRLFFFRLAEDFNWKLNSALTFDEKFEFFPEIGEWGDYRFRFEANLRYWLKNAKNLSLTLTLLDQYDTRPAQGVGRNDLQVRSSVGLKF